MLRGYFSVQLLFLGIGIAIRLLLQHPQAGYRGDGQRECNGTGGGIGAAFSGDCLHDFPFFSGFGHNQNQFLFLRQGNTEEFFRLLVS